jgi:hypothetical protein
VIVKFATESKKGIYSQTCDRTNKWESSWWWSYGSWIYNYLCNRCLSPLTLWVWIPLMVCCCKVCHRIKERNLQSNLSVRSSLFHSHLYEKVTFLGIIGLDKLYIPMYKNIMNDMFFFWCMLILVYIILNRPIPWQNVTIETTYMWLIFCYSSNLVNIIRNIHDYEMQIKF